MPKLIERIRVVGFDLDGTLIDTAPDLAAATNMMLTLLGGPMLPESRIRELIGNGVDLLVARAVRESLGGAEPRPELLTAATALFAPLYRQRLFAESRVYSGVLEALRDLNSTGLASCCITNKRSAFALPLLEAAGLHELFELTLCADRPEERKPGPSLLLAACARFGATPPEMLYVGDSDTDVLAARNAGCRVVVVDYGYNRGRPFEESRPDAVISSLAEISALRVRPWSARSDGQDVLLRIRS